MTYLTPESIKRKKHGHRISFNDDEPREAYCGIVIHM